MSLRALPPLPLKRCGLAVAILLCGLSSGAVFAHPHGWIDLSVRLVLDDQGRATALHQSWRMDPFYSLVVVEELEASAGESGIEAGLDQLGGEIRDNLRPHGYFTEVELGGEPLATGDVTEYTVMHRDARVEFVFLLPLAEPQPMNGETLRYRVFDPTYYLEVVHEAGDAGPRDAALTVSGGDCQRRILPADPDPERVMEAAMLDRTDEAAPGLGRHFAETGEVTC
ncbi:DUF1007 family protein [Billgrantia gudaonensis]|uniref:ABC-type uncharacterized transport system, substrate-binding protein n=1 Tax=Billgrantia gudaonensis TaxID=376427 RepID=A0A1G8Z3F6_9GAMM|nr:DUF1007 family protein [Halomonas gudaonensis]SDK09652.1 ABC-type uncharacterized transport system, substrate-binding protein [Halomonas gudaonensis]